MGKGRKGPKKDFGRQSKKGTNRASKSKARHLNKSQNKRSREYGTACLKPRSLLHSSYNLVAMAQAFLEIVLESKNSPVNHGMKTVDASKGGFLERYFPGTSSAYFFQSVGKHVFRIIFLAIAQQLYNEKIFTQNTISTGKDWSELYPSYTPILPLDTPNNESKAESTIPPLDDSNVPAQKEVVVLEAEKELILEIERFLIEYPSIVCSLEDVLFEGKSTSKEEEEISRDHYGRFLRTCLYNAYASGEMESIEKLLNAPAAGGASTGAREEIPSGESGMAGIRSLLKSPGIVHFDGELDPTTYLNDAFYIALRINAKFDVVTGDIVPDPENENDIKIINIVRIVKGIIREHYTFRDYKFQFTPT